MITPSETGTPSTGDEAPSAGMIETFLQVQVEAMAGHARATAAQQFPAYTGEGKQMTALL